MLLLPKRWRIANKIAARCQYRFRVVTLEGDVVNAGGSMTGGSQHKKNVSLLSRKRQLDQLDQDILDTENQIVKLHRRVDDAKVQLEQCQDKLDELRQSGDDTRNAEHRLRWK